ncbi:6,7-dimethyl-8-ribityllumazine synthase [Candidatus Endowatersipora endosymbiont of Watersipora subatra]|uniref:6,7-dimethyl-8-ribityllumazine synthase n=1 Tax=Candidatus Endowatersipora endosymbiont of Watersipora subatra TaxID=3077946 RepID=UPI00312C8E53
MSHILIVNAIYYPEISKLLLDGAQQVLKASEATWESVSVPGVLEIPPTLSMALTGMQRCGTHYDGFITLGCVVRGETSHYDIVAFESARAIVHLTTSKCIALGNGIQTVENENQAFARASTKRKNKGGSAAHVVLDMIKLRDRFLVETS